MSASLYHSRACDWDEVRRLREDGLTQRAIARQLGVALSTVQRALAAETTKPRPYGKQTRRTRKRGTIWRDYGGWKARFITAEGRRRDFCLGRINREEAEAVLDEMIFKDDVRAARVLLRRRAARASRPTTTQAMSACYGFLRQALDAAEVARQSAQLEERRAVAEAFPFLYNAEDALSAGL